jgi:hypothetical protein
MNAIFCENCGTALEPGQRFCGGCGQPVDATTPVAQQPMMTTPLSMVADTKDNWRLPTWGWLVLGLFFAGLVGGGLFYVFSSVSPKPPALTTAQEDSIRKHVLEDLPVRDAVDLEKATNPTDLPPDLQKKFDNSSLSDEHARQMAEALAPLPRIGDEIVNTKRVPTVSDDFSDPGSGWRVGEDAKAVREYADGRLQVTFTAARGSAQVILPKTAGNFAMQVEASPVASPPKFWYGVTLRQSTSDKFIVFLISPQGHYAISKRENGKNVPVSEPFTSPFIKKGMATNVIKVYAVDENFVFEVNGKLVEVQQIPGFEPGAVGVMVLRSPNDTTDPTTVAFDNFKLWAGR